MLELELLHRIVDIIEAYLPVFNEDAIRNSFVTIYQLLDEIIDNGFPITTELAVLQELIIPQHNKILSSVPVSSNLPANASSPVSWRRSGIKYTNNEIFFDLIEEADCIIDSNGAVVSCDISGKILVNCHLSGMPDVVVSFINPNILDDCSFHPCVRYSRFEQDKVLSFIPADGNFELIKYRANGIIVPPVYVKPQISFNESGGRINLIAGTRNTDGKSVDDVAFSIILPKSVDSVTASAVSPGFIKFSNVTKELRWEVGRINPKQTASLTATLTLQHGSFVPDSTPPVLVSFKITSVCLSGLKIDSVQLINEKYKPFKGLKTMSKAGNYQIRTC